MCLIRIVISGSLCYHSKEIRKRRCIFAYEKGLLNLYKVLVADGEEEFGRLLAENLSENYQLQVCHDGETAWEYLRKFEPDMLILDLMLPVLDGVTLLQMMHEQGLRLLTLATTRLANEYVMEAMEKYRVGYLMIKPCSVKAVTMRVADLFEHRNVNTALTSDPRKKISDALLELGFPVKLKGFCCICDATLLLRQDYSQSITKEIYPAVGKIAGVTPQKVERAIRNSIACAWRRRDVQMWARYFRLEKNGDVRRPTNGELLARLAHTIELDE